MTDVAFYVNVPDPLAYAGRLVRKAHSKGMSVLVWGHSGQLATLDERLWSMRPTDFVSHCLATASPGLCKRSSVVLTDDMSQLPERSFDALLNLTNEVPAGYSAFHRLFEVVSAAEDDLLAARRRWRAYTADGVVPKRHEISV